MNRKRKLSDGKAVLISEKLKLRPAQRQLFINMVRLELSRDSGSQDILRSEISRLIRKNPEFTVLSEDKFNVVADWYCFAILELTSLKAFKSDPSWISKRLNVPVRQIEIAIDRLKRVGLLVEADGELRKTEKDYVFENVPSLAIRKHHHQTLHLAHTALERQPLAQREFFTVCMPMDPACIKKAKSLIREFCNRLMAEVQETEPKSVYKLAVQFFRLDKEHA